MADGATSITLDLSTIGLATGAHTIQMRLSDDGIRKRDSGFSNPVTYVQTDPTPQLDAPSNLDADGTTISFDAVEGAESYEVFADGVSIGEFEPEPEPTGETWLINEVPTITALNIDINFVSKNDNFVTFKLSTRSGGELDYESDLDYVKAYTGNSGWVDEDYRTVQFETVPTGDLLTWLQANAVKQ